MKNVLTFFLPGLGQLLNGDAKKTGNIFLSAIITGALSGGLWYLACGAWSVVDLTSSEARAASSSVVAIAGTARLGRQPDSPGGINALMPWLFKFSFLGLCAFLVLNNRPSGGMLQSLERSA